MSNKKILIVDDEEAILDIMEMIIESNYDVDIIKAGSGNQAIDVLSKNRDISLIFCDYRMNDGNGAVVYEYINKNDLKIPFILCSTYEPEQLKEFKDYFKNKGLKFYIAKPFTSEDLLEHVENIFAETFKDREISPYARVRADRFMRFNQKRDLEIYIRLSEEKYVKVIDNKTDTYSDILQKYIDKGVEYFYLEKKAYEDFVSNRFDEIAWISKEIKNPQLDESKKVDLLFETYDDINEAIINLGASERVVEMVNAVVSSTIDAINSNKSLKGLLELLDSREGYIKSHAYLTSYVACSVASEMKWTSATIWEKLTTAALFQNLSLDDEKLARIFDIESDEFSNLPAGEQDKVIEHPRKSSAMIKVDEVFFDDVHKLIVNHHELPGGKGFPRRLDSTQVAPLEALFIIATNFAHRLITKDKDDSIGIIVQDFNVEFDKGIYKQPYQGFLNTFSKLN